MYNIVFGKKSPYEDISIKTKTIRKTGFFANEKATETIGYDNRTNEIKNATIKKREIKGNI